MEYLRLKLCKIFNQAKFKKYSGDWWGDSFILKIFIFKVSYGWTKEIDTWKRFFRIVLTMINKVLFIKARHDNFIRCRIFIQCRLPINSFSTKSIIIFFSSKKLNKIMFVWFYFKQHQQCGKKQNELIL